MKTGGEIIPPLFCVIFILPSKLAKLRPSAQLYYQKIDEDEKSAPVSPYRIQLFMGYSWKKIPLTS